MIFHRCSGILLHPTSLPGKFGIGELGPQAYRFADFLADTGQGIWQVLPLGPTGYGDSPYQCFSAFAGNPLLVSLEKLVELGDLSPGDLERDLPLFPECQVDFGWVIVYKFPLLRKAAENFRARASAARRENYEEFCRRNSSWLDNYALFIALKAEHGGKAVWNKWERDIATRQPEALARWRERLADEIALQKYSQYQFFTQWSELKTYCHERGIKIMGDIPIFVAHDSADVWVHPDQFHLDSDGNPSAQSGVPPDYFSATGQLWGNPVYRWDTMAKTGYSWWIERFRSALRLVDIIRLDHFRGFEAYWEIPAGEKTAVNGRWVKGPGADLFDKVQKTLGDLPIVAETLGVITPEVTALRDQFGFPGMGILQFGFGTDPQSPEFKPHNFHRHFVVYTGTHDNDTTLGWWTSRGVGDSTRSAENIRKEREFACKYLGTDGREMNWVFIRTLLSSVADMAIIPLQDILGLGGEARMNLPARPGGNWRWRFTAAQLTPEIAERLAELVRIYDRTLEAVEKTPARVVAAPASL
jgi:4-alpha-glucanotransferase